MASASWQWLLGQRGLVVLATVFVLGFSPVVGFDLVWDDSIIVESQAQAASLWEGLVASQQQQAASEQSQTEGFELPYDSYRPLLFASYRIDRTLGQLQPALLHGHSLLLGLLNVLLLASLLAQLGIETRLRAVVVGAFALHPVQIETVAYVSARGDLLAALFVLLACHAALRAARAEGRVGQFGHAALSGLLYFASLLSKETYLGWPVMLLVVGFAVGALRRVLAGGWAGLAALVLYLVTRMLAVGQDGARLGREGPGELLMRVPGIVAQTLQAIVVPLDISIHRASDSAFTVAGVVLILLAVVGLLQPRIAFRPAAAAAICAFGIAAPLAVPISDTGMISDRYLYLMTPLWTFALGRGLSLALRTRAPLSRLPALLLGLWAAVGIALWPSVLMAWKSDYALYTRAVEIAPERTESWYRLGYLYLRDGDPVRAAQLLQRSLQLSPENQLALNNMGVSLMRQGAFDAAIGYFDRALSSSGGKHYRACYNKGMALLAAQRTDLACAQFRACLGINRSYAAPRRALREHCPP